MSLLFSEVTLRRKDGVETGLYEGGNPDEYDMRELLKIGAQYAGARSYGLCGLSVQVQHYRFLEGGSRDWLAEREHIALIEAYDKAANPLYSVTTWSAWNPMSSRSWTEY